MKFFFRLIVMASVISCTPPKKDKIELIEQFDYRIKIDFSNGFSRFRSTFLLDNLQKSSYDSTVNQFSFCKPFSFYYISNNKMYERLKSNPKNYNLFDTTETLFSKKQSDSLFYLTRNFFKSIELNNYDSSINGSISKPIYLNVTWVNISLDYGGITWYISVNTANPTFYKEEWYALLKFIDRF